MSAKLVIGVTAGLAVGVAAGWLAGGAGAADVARIEQQLADVQQERDEVADERTAATTELETLKRRLGRMDRDLDVARAALATAEQDAARVRAEAAASVAEVEETIAAAADETLGNGQAFSFPAYDEHLAAIDWKDVGEHMSAMAPILSEVMSSVAKGERPSPEAIGGMQRHNGPLVTAAMKLHGKVPGESVNGAFTHPSAAVNMIASTLDAMEMPLTDEQQRALDRIGHEFVTEDEKRIANYADDVLTMRRFTDEAELKGRFYDAAMAALTEEQHNALRPEATRGRVTVDLFCSSLVWVGRVRPVPFESTEELAETLTDRMARSLELEGEAKERLRATLSDWAAGLPSELTTREPDTLWLKGMIPSDVVDMSAEQQVVLMQRMIRDLDLSDEAETELREHAGVFVPTYRPAN